MEVFQVLELPPPILGVWEVRLEKELEGRSIVGLRHHNEVRVFRPDLDHIAVMRVGLSKSPLGFGKGPKNELFGEMFAQKVPEAIPPNETYLMIDSRTDERRLKALQSFGTDVM